MFLVEEPKYIVLIIHDGNEKLNRLDKSEQTRNIRNSDRYSLIQEDTVVQESCWES